MHMLLLAATLALSSQGGSRQSWSAVNVCDTVRVELR